MLIKDHLNTIEWIDEMRWWIQDRNERRNRVMCLRDVEIK